MDRMYGTRLRSVRQECGLRQVDVAASLALDAGVPVQDVARQLGHSVETCQRTYAHFIGDDLRRAAKAIGKALLHRFSGPKRVPRAKNGTR